MCRRSLCKFKIRNNYCMALMLEGSKSKRDEHAPWNFCHSGVPHKRMTEFCLAWPTHFSFPLISNPDLQITKKPREMLQDGFINEVNTNKSFRISGLNVFHFFSTWYQKIQSTRSHPDFIYEYIIQHQQWK